jgi:hypothetical protein
MTQIFYGFLIRLSILFCGFVGAPALAQQQRSISKAIALIKSYVDNRGLFAVTIVNSHNGRYTINSSILAGPDSVRLITHVVDMTGGKRDTTINLGKKDFLVKLDRASSPVNSIKLAGHFQRILIKRNDLENIVESVDGRALMNLLEHGE